MKGFRMRTGVGLVLVVALIVTACGSDEADVTTSVASDTTEPQGDASTTSAVDSQETTSTTGEPQELQQIRMIFGAGGGVLPPHVAPLTSALANGFFEDEGLEVEFTSVSGAGGSMGALAGGQADIAVTVVSPLLQTAADTDDFGVINVFQWSQQGNALMVVRPDETEITSIDDITAETPIGVLAFSESSYLTLTKSLESRGIDPETANITAVGYGAQAAEALTSGQIDVMMAFGGAIANIENVGVEVKALPAPPEWRQVPHVGLGTGVETLQERRDIVLRGLRAFAKGQLFALANREAAIALHYSIVPESVPTGVTREEAIQQGVTWLEAEAQFWNKCDGLDPECPDWQLGHHSPEDWAFTVDYLGLADQITDPTAFFTNEFVDEINDFDKAALIEQARSFDVDAVDF